MKEEKERGARGEERIYPLSFSRDETDTIERGKSDEWGEKNRERGGREECFLLSARACTHCDQT